MNDTATFKIYNASAGSGKTFTLVKAYLTCILKSKNESYYQHLLAITFTNKAVAEMKQRILKNLISFSAEESIESSSEMLLQIAEELELTTNEIHWRSKKILKHLLHHYAKFSIETIDRFNHRLIRTFARDLKLTSNFEVSLDTPQLLTEAVDQLLNKAGEEKQVTKLLLDFAMEKTDDDRSWDISKDIASASELLYKEGHSNHLELLKEKSLSDFTKFKNYLKQQRDKTSEEIKSIALQMLQLIDESGLEHTDFNGGYLPKHFLKLSLENFHLNFNTKWQSDIGEKPLYPKRVDISIGSIIDELAPTFQEKLERSKQLCFEFQLFENILKNLTPLSVINLVQQEIESIKEEKNILPISEFNSLINTEIKDQPAPFVYERLGERYRHFFIDEFQDTSQLQWENLRPLIDNALSQQDPNQRSGSLLLVGDAKQSIYRWRGGLPEQFMDLYSDKNPFPSSEKEVLNLETNFRSCQQIIDFNNQFFSFTSSCFSNVVHKELYEIGNQQVFNSKKGGYIKFNFLEKQSAESRSEEYCELVFDTIIDCRERGFMDSEICILTRTKKDGIYIGNHLMEKNIPVISSETLLLQSSSTVQLIVEALKLSVYPNNDEAKMILLSLLHDLLAISEEKHSFLSQFLGNTKTDFDKILATYGIDFEYEELRSLSLYEGSEYIIRQFDLDQQADAYLLSFLDYVFEFSQQPQANKISFLETWETDKSKASIPANEGIDAVQLMTIHKAKGLEFPIVIFPFSDIKIYDSKNDILWYRLGPESEDVFTETPVTFKKEIANYGVQGEELYDLHQNQLKLDSLNLLYVTLTRAIERLYVFAEKPADVKTDGPTSFNQLFGEFLKHKGIWNDDLLSYEFGELERTQKILRPEQLNYKVPSFIASTPEQHNLNIITSEGDLWDTDLQSAIIEGNILHDIMALICSAEDINSALNTIIESNTYAPENISVLKDKVHSIVNHPDLRNAFSSNVRVENERDIITASGSILRPDRIVFNKDQSVTIIDYKTGIPDYHHEDQINSYARALTEMGQIVSEKILVYTNQDEIVINKL